MSLLTNNAVYSITNKNSGMVLAVEQASQSNGAAVIQYTWQDGPEQLWRAVEIGNDIYQFIVLSSNQVMAISQASTSNGGQVIQYPNQNGPEQQFQLTVATGGQPWLWIQSVNSGLYVSITAASTALGAQAEQWQLGTTDEYRFSFAQQN